jgi:predicted nucleic acid-binding protein
MVAAVCSWHERHAAALTEIERRIDRGERMVVAAHALVEAYAVLTRLPAPHRLAPADAWKLVRANFVEHATVVPLSARGHVAVLSRLASSGLGGGRAYDGVIAASAAQAKVQALLTFDRRHFDPPLDRIHVVEPADPD